MDYVLEQLLRQRALFISLLASKPSKRQIEEAENAKVPIKFGLQPTATEEQTDGMKMEPEEMKNSLLFQSDEFPQSSNQMSGESEQGLSRTFRKPGMKMIKETNETTEQWLREVPIGVTFSAEDISHQLERDARRYDGDLTLL